MNRRDSVMRTDSLGVTFLCLSRRSAVPAASVGVREVVLAQVHSRAHDVVAVVGDPPAPGARYLGDQAAGMQAANEWLAAHATVGRAWRPVYESA